MQTFFRNEMVVTAEDATIPSHQKISQLIAILQEDERIKIVRDFAPVTEKQWIGFHDADYVRRIIDLDGSVFEEASIPVSRAMADAVMLSAGSMVSAAMAATMTGCAFSPTAGFHHAHWSRPGPFCLLNAVPLSACHLLRETAVERVLVLDCDFHRGDGTDAILARIADERICHISMGFRFSHRSRSTAYLGEIRRIAKSIEDRAYDLVIYKAGMDVLAGDPAGGGILTLTEVSERDAMVFSACRTANVPVVWNLAGGYQRPFGGFGPVIQGHLSTVECALKVFFTL